MHYKLIQPPDSLAGYIRYGWQVENDAKMGLPQPFGVVADGCPGLIFYQSERGSMYNARKRLPTVFLYGQSTQPTQLHLPDTFRMLGICFYPTALKTIFGLNAYELTNSCMDVRELPNSHQDHLPEQLLNNPLLTDQIDSLFTYLGARIQGNPIPDDPVTHYVLSRMVEQEGNVSLKELQEKTQISERSLERRFKQSVGISPKLFARICRFQASVQQLKHKNYDKLSDVAFDRGYADQSHFIRTFKEFAGILPEQYGKQSNGIIENLPELVA